MDGWIMCCLYKIHQDRPSFCLSYRLSAHGHTNSVQVDLLYCKSGIKVIYMIAQYISCITSYMLMFVTMTVKTGHVKTGMTHSTKVFCFIVCLFGMEQSQSHFISLQNNPLSIKTNQLRSFFISLIFFKKGLESDLVREICQSPT